MNSLLLAAANPLIPNGFDVIWTLIMGAGVALFIVGLVLAAKVDENPKVRLLLAILVLALPFIGSLGVIWLYSSQRRKTSATA